MKYAIVCAFWIFTLAYGQLLQNSTRKRINKDAREVEWHWIELPLDHYNLLDNRTYRARYITNDQFYKNGGPIIVYIGGEWAIESYGAMGGIAFQLARTYNGYIFYPEHRYYGESLPFPKPVSTEDLKYITPDYSLADLAYSITHLKKTIKGLQNSQVVVVGGSYAGALATWARLKYPHIINMAYACGGAINSRMNNEDYYDVLYQVYNKISPECLNIILAGVRKAKKLQTSRKGMAKLEAMFPSVVCNSSGQPLFDFAERLHVRFNFQIWPVYRVVQECHFLESNTTGSPLERLKRMFNIPGGEVALCDELGREWYYLVCTFLGAIQSSNKNNFGDMYNFDKQLKVWCTDSFGFNKDFVELRANRTTKLFNGNNPVATKILSVQGTHDVWRPDSILDDLNDETPVVYIDGATHCLEIGEEQDDETPQVAQAKIEIMQQLAKWLR